MNAIESRLIERLKNLPAARVAQVADFIEFLATREERAVAAQQLADDLAKLDALKLPPVSESEIESEIQAVRQERRTSESA